MPIRAHRLSGRLSERLPILILANGDLTSCPARAGCRAVPRKVVVRRESGKSAFFVGVRLCKRARALL